jgi:hypothetical protein
MPLDALAAGRRAQFRGDPNGRPIIETVAVRLALQLQLKKKPFVPSSCPGKQASTASRHEHSSTGLKEMVRHCWMPRAGQ